MHELDLITPQPKLNVLYPAIVSNDVTDPSDDLMVRIPSFDGDEREWGPCPWQPRVDASGGADYPSRDDAAWVQFDTNKTPVCVLWSPYG